ncbi:hypothetical protein [Gemmata sp.]|uniref:hypothetical protein n=1 Tax=Gemmata sp. TaxID=1914242 RepID=UPI003F6EC4C0
MGSTSKGNARTGRPFALTPQVFKALAEATTNGLPRKAAAQCAGVGASTLMSYLRQGRDQRTRLPPSVFAKWMAGDHTLTLPQRQQALAELRHALEKARGAAIKRNVEIIQRAALGSQVVERRTLHHQDGTSEVVEKFAAAQWTAAAWWLERCESQDFGRKDKTETTVKAASGERGAAILIVDGPAKVNPPVDESAPD